MTFVQMIHDLEKKGIKVMEAKTEDEIEARRQEYFAAKGKLINLADKIDLLINQVRYEKEKA